MKHDQVKRPVSLVTVHPDGFRSQPLIAAYTPKRLGLLVEGWLTAERNEAVGLDISAVEVSQ